MPEQLPDVLFYAALAVAGVGWLALILFPRRSWANFWFSGLVVPVLLGVLYTVVMAVFWFEPPAGRVYQFLSLHGLSGMFQNRGLLLAAWIDLLAMPLIAGAWMARRAAQVKMPYVFLFVCLVLTLTVPGIGMALYVLLLAIRGRLQAIADFEQAEAGAMEAHLW
ncbi:MAG TPA: abscisic acid-deficient protein Aba4 family protein [Thermoanaerobaculia bacterium]|nr:abscisic acid-deficient protein Aba4 family protein [Thermoanaerobaculia bacterium]